MTDRATTKKPGLRLFKKPSTPIDTKRLFFLLLGLGLFFAVYLSPPWPAAIDPMGESFELSAQGKAALALFLLAAVWWVFEVVPIGVTSIAIAVTQALFLIRPDKFFVGETDPIGGPELAMKEFFHPSVWFIFGSIVIGMVFTKTGLTKRLAYKMLAIVGEKTSMIYLGCFVMTAALTLVMAHTAVAATIFPLLVAIYRLYDEGDEPTKFGKGLFMGMAYVAGAGSIITLLGAARGAVALGFYKEITGQGCHLLRAHLVHAPHRYGHGLRPVGLFSWSTTNPSGPRSRGCANAPAISTPNSAESPARRFSRRPSS